MTLEIQKNFITRDTFYMQIRGGGIGADGWIAKILGRDEKFGFARSFCSKRREGTVRSGTLEFSLTGKGVYEFRNLCYNSSKSFSGFFVISDDEIFQIEKEDVLDYI